MSAYKTMLRSLSRPELDALVAHQSGGDPPGRCPLLARLFQVHERPRYDLAPELKSEDPAAYHRALFEACR